MVTVVTVRPSNRQFNESSSQKSTELHKCLHKNKFRPTLTSDEQQDERLSSMSGVPMNRSESRQNPSCPSGVETTDSLCMSV